MIPDEALEAATRAIHDMDCDTQCDGETLTTEGRYGRWARAALEAAEAVREQGEERTEWGVRWHGSDDDDAIRSSRQHLGSRALAEETGPELVGQYGITRFTVHQRLHRIYADGSSWTGPWVEAGRERSPDPYPSGRTSATAGQREVWCTRCVGSGHIEGNCPQPESGREHSPGPRPLPVDPAAGEGTWAEGADPPPGRWCTFCGTGPCNGFLGNPCEAPS